MIVVLYDKFFHLADGVIPSIRHVLGDVRNLCPDYHSSLITKIIEILTVLIVSKSYGIGTHLADKVYILFVHFICYGISKAFSVLMS